jgi:hypothetical protein
MQQTITYSLPVLPYITLQHTLYTTNYNVWKCYRWLFVAINFIIVSSNDAHLAPLRCM